MPNPIVIRRLILASPAPGVGVPAWVKAISPSAIAAWDLRTDQRHRLATLFSRASESYMLGLGSDIQRFDVDVVARIDGVGGQFETAKTRISKYPRQLAGSNWISGSGATVQALAAEGIFTEPCRVISAGASAARRQSPTFALDAGADYRVKVRYRAGTSPNCRINISSVTPNTNAVLSGAVGALSATDQTLGAIANVVNTALGGSLYEVSFTFTPAATLSDYRVAAGPGSTISGQYVDILGCEVISGDGQSSWIFGDGSQQVTRAAVILTIYPALGGPYDLRAILGNDAVQVIAEAITGPIILDPDLLGVPTVKAFFLTRPGAVVDPPSTAGYYSVLDASGFSPSRVPWLSRTLGVHTGAVSYPNKDYSLQFSSLKTKAKFELHDTIYDRKASDPEYKRRAEMFWSTLAGNEQLQYGVEYWVAYQFKFATPTDPTGLGTNNVVLDQIVDPDVPSSAIISTRYVAGNLRVMTRAASDSTSGTARYDQPIVTNVVHDFVRRVVLGEAGQIDAWLDGTQIVSLTGIPIGKSVANPPRMQPKVGLYASTGMAGIIACEFANFAFWNGNSLAARVASPPTWPND